MPQVALAGELRRSAFLGNTPMPSADRPSGRGITRPRTKPPNRLVKEHGWTLSSCNGSSRQNATGAGGCWLLLNCELVEIWCAQRRWFWTTYVATSRVVTSANTLSRLRRHVRSGTRREQQNRIALEALHRTSHHNHPLRPVSQERVLHHSRKASRGPLPSCRHAGGSRTGGGLEVRRCALGVGAEAESTLRALVQSEGARIERNS